MEEGHARVPLHRSATNEEVAEAVRYLASPAAEYITGHTLVLDYSGDTVYAPSSKTITQKIDPAPTATTVTTVAPLTTPFYGEQGGQVGDIGAELEWIFGQRQGTFRFGSQSPQFGAAPVTWSHAKFPST